MLPPGGAETASQLQVLEPYATDVALDAFRAMLVLGVERA